MIRIKCEGPYKRKRSLKKKILIALILIFTPFLIYWAIMAVDGACTYYGGELPELPSAAEAPTVEAVQTEETIPQAPLFDIPLSDELQEYTYWTCVDYDVDYMLVLAIMDVESDYRADAIGSGNYGLMQINQSNHDYISETIGVTDFLDPKQNIEAGIFWLSGITPDDPSMKLMVYNMGGRRAKELWNQGIYSTSYSISVLSVVEELEGKRK